MISTNFKGRSKMERKATASKQAKGSEGGTRTDLALAQPSAFSRLLLRRTAFTDILVHLDWRSINNAFSASSAWATERVRRDGAISAAYLDSYHRQIWSRKASSSKKFFPFPSKTRIIKLLVHKGDIFVFMTKIYARD